ncbi:MULTISPECIES: hypothetical protein [unclassified Bradyrhizobium]|uniref:hypothetical protein n=1 Tax=Bradyrhizobium TaxID=374 RepID=UPI0028E39427|nr:MULTISPECIES: hypothetical protein [unclassified Bradyrhizobium]
MRTINSSAFERIIFCDDDRLQEIIKIVRQFNGQRRKVVDEIERILIWWATPAVS